MLTMTPRTRFVGRSARNGRAASESVQAAISITGGGIRVVISADRPLYGSRKRNHLTTKIPNNNRRHLYRHEAAATDQSKPRWRADDHSGHSGQHHRAEAAGVWHRGGTA